MNVRPGLDVDGLSPAESLSQDQQAGSAASQPPTPPPLRSASAPRRVIQFDFVRGLAILAVMEYHFATVPVANVFAHVFEDSGKHLGWMGVDLFFVLSGFLVGGLLVQELRATGTLRVQRFLTRRMFKIWPAYYVYILFQLLLRRHPARSFAWQNILNVQNYAGTTLNHTWSLAVEEHFYLFLPLLLLVLYRGPTLRPRIVPILAGICVLVLAGRIVSVYAFHALDPQWLTHARIDGLLFGVILSFGLYNHRPAFERLLEHRIPLALVALAGLLFAASRSHQSRAMWSFGYTLNYLSLGAVLLLVYGYHGRLIHTRLYRAVAAIGVYSYGIYLWHLSVREPLAHLVARLPARVQWGTLLIAQYAAAILLGVLMTKAVEFPMLRLRERLVPRGPAQLPPAVA